METIVRKEQPFLGQQGVVCKRKLTKKGCQLLLKVKKTPLFMGLPVIMAP
ncbi:MAG: hypothetical protein ACLSIA_20215 [[Clostridium] innocuum]|nr:hypothetical protein [[Clostridium] innocuum]